MEGEWTYHASLTVYDSTVFNTAVDESYDYYYRPIVVAEQIGNGINYRFICMAEPKRKDRETHFALIAIHKPFHGPGYVTGINRI
ncbi:MAG: hypothetical protein Q4F05_16765 [bacterium]|nr:hypothetical protein [bacterium]MDO5520920.1 hypothetical protein [bacterium]